MKGIAVRVGSTTPEAMATLIVASQTDMRVRAAARQALAGHSAPTSLHVNVHPRNDAYIFGRDTRHVAGPERLREDIGGVSFLISSTAFFQTNVRAADALVRLVLAAVPEGATVLDLYAGAGLFALTLAKRGNRVVAIEESRVAVADGEASMRLSRVPPERCPFIQKPVEGALRAKHPRVPPDAVVLDPPREGCTAVVLERTAESRHGDHEDGEARSARRSRRL